MQIFGMICIFTFLFTNLASASGVNIDVTAQVGPDPWSMYYDRFSTEHTECSPVSGFILVQPQYVRTLAFYDATQKYPMILSTASLDDVPDFVMSNHSCRFDMTVSRTLGWDAQGSAAPSSVSRNNNNPSADTPEMVAEVHYNDSTLACSQFDLPFMLNSRNISFPQSASFRSGYKILFGHDGSPDSPNDRDVETLTLSKIGCIIQIKLFLQIRKDEIWIRQMFK